MCYIVLILHKHQDAPAGHTDFGGNTIDRKGSSSFDKSRGPSGHIIKTSGTTSKSTTKVRRMGWGRFMGTPHTPPAALI